MKPTGKDFIRIICYHLDDEDVRCYDSAIVRKLRSLTMRQIEQIVSDGNFDEQDDMEV